MRRCRRRAAGGRRVWRPQRRRRGHSELLRASLVPAAVRPRGTRRRHSWPRRVRGSGGRTTLAPAPAVPLRDRRAPDASTRRSARSRRRAQARARRRTSRRPSSRRRTTAVCCRVPAPSLTFGRVAVATIMDLETATSVRMLAADLRAHMRHSHLSVLALDRADALASVDAELVRPGEIGAADDPALRPLFLQFLLEREESVVLLDPETRIFGALHDL